MNEGSKEGDSAGLRTVAQAARYLGRSRSWIDKERAEGRGPRFLQMGARVMYRKEDLDAYIDSCACEPVTSTTKAAA